jgi:hypothetical protein
MDVRKNGATFLNGARRKRALNRFLQDVVIQSAAVAFQQNPAGSVIAAESGKPSGMDRLACQSTLPCRRIVALKQRTSILCVDFDSMRVKPRIIG